jgi:hypothetical protein
VCTAEGLEVIKAIETHYAGHRFRSRLEARWAVAFNEIGLKWQYEPQGFTLERRLSAWGSETLDWNYLPDFFLPGMNCYGEVKGALDTQGLWRLLDCAASLSESGTDLIVFGEIPGMGEFDRAHHVGPTRLTFHEGTLIARPWWQLDQFPSYDVANDSAEIYWPEASVARWMLEGTQNRNGVSGYPPALDRAYDAARKARFEHGEQG